MLVSKEIYKIVIFITLISLKVFRLVNNVYQVIIKQMMKLNVLKEMY